MTNTETLVFKNSNGDVVKNRKLNKTCELVPYSYELEDGYIVFRDDRGPMFFSKILMKIKVPNKEWSSVEVVEKSEKNLKKRLDF